MLLLFSLQGRERIIEEAQQISKIQKQVGMQVPVEYEETFKFGLMEVVFEWARGMVRFYLSHLNFFERKT